MFSILREKEKLNLEQEFPNSEDNHFIFQKKLKRPFSDGIKKIMLGMGCFWGVEKLFWNLKGVEMTAVGYSGGTVIDPTYNNVCLSDTGHNEVLLLHYNPTIISTDTILKKFWEGHNPTQGMRQGNDIGDQYRSGIYTYGLDDHGLAFETKLVYQETLANAGYGKITTEILEAKQFYYAERYHQQYLAKNPNGYCGIGGTGVSF